MTEDRPLDPDEELGPGEPAAEGFWNRPLGTLVLPLLAVGVTLLLPGLGVLVAALLALVAVALGRSQKARADVGFRAPGSWPKLLAITLGYGLALQAAVTVVVEPLCERWTGEAIDLSAFEGVRGEFAAFLILLSIGWVVGGLIEEFTFRGFVLGRLRRGLGGGAGATTVAVLASVVPFGLAHLYQGWSGVLSTGFAGLVLALVYLGHRQNLWYAICTHGFVNTVGIALIYLDVDEALRHLLF